MVYYAKCVLINLQIDKIWKALQPLLPKQELGWSSPLQVLTCLRCCKTAGADAIGILDVIKLLSGWYKELLSL